MAIGFLINNFHFIFLSFNLMRIKLYIIILGYFNVVSTPVVTASADFSREGFQNCESDFLCQERWSKIVQSIKGSRYNCNALLHCGDTFLEWTAWL